MNINQKTVKIIYGAVFAAIITVATMFVHIPTIKGYVHLGDAFVILSGIFLGPVIGGMAAGIGSMLSDVILGYAAFAPITFIVKFGAAALSGYVFKKIQDKDIKIRVKTIIAGVMAIVVIVPGYFVFEIFYEGFTPAVLEIIPNIIQVVSGIVIETLFYPVFFALLNVKNGLKSYV